MISFAEVWLLAAIPPSAAPATPSRRSHRSRIESSYQAGTPVTAVGCSSYPLLRGCDVPIPNGVLRYELEAIGPDAVARESIGVIRSMEEERARAELRARAEMMIFARIICTENRAFVVLTHEEGPDSIFVYHMSGEVDRVSVPTEFTEDRGCRMDGKPCPPWSRNLHPSFDDRGNLVLLSNDWVTVTGGTIINPETGCYAILRKGGRNDMTRIPVRVRGDSVLVFQQDQEQREDGTFHFICSGEARTKCRCTRSEP